jgi:hypothetical protein
VKSATTLTLANPRQEAKVNRSFLGEYAFIEIYTSCPRPHQITAG